MKNKDKIKKLKKEIIILKKENETLRNAYLSQKRENEVKQRVTIAYT